VTKTTLVAVFGWTCLLGGALLTSWAVLTVLDARASLAWPTVTGRVLSARVERTVSRSTSGTRDYRYRASVSYRYSVEGESYSGDRVSFLTDYYDSAEAAGATIARFASGNEVMVRYKPGEPGEAVLESNYGWGSYLPLGLSAFLFVVGALMVKAARFQAQKEQPRSPV